MTEQRIQEARQLHLRGELARAISAYDEVLASDPALAEVWHLKGMAEHQAGKLAEAQASAARAIASGGERPGFLLLEAGVLHDRGELAAAQDRYARVVAAKPDWAVGHLELGRVQMDQGRADIAVESFRTAVTLDPKYVRAWNNLGVALQNLDRMDEAIRAFTHTLSLDARYALAHFNLARIYNLRADSKRALEHAQAAVKADERLSEGWLLVGDIHRRNREAQPALTAYGMAIRAAPGDLKAPNAYAEMLAEIGRFEEAKRAYAQIAGRASGNLKAALGANLLLPHVYDSVDHIEASRRSYTEGLERLHEAAPRFAFASGESALTEARWTNFYLAYQGKNDLDLQKRYGQFQRRVLEPSLPEFFRPRPRRAGGERIRVGFFSHFFFNCTAGRYFSSWITRLDKTRFETFVYYTNEWVADDTRIIGAAADTYRHLPGRPLYNLARQVADDHLDILVYPELGMHPDTFTLGGLRLAPVQCSGWGHPNTTGLSEIDWFISCEGMEPADGASRYSERLALLPGLGTRYAVPKGASGGSRSDFGIPEDHTAYLVPQMLFKVHPDNDELIAEVLKRDPRGVVVMFASTHDALTQAFATRLSRSLERRGLNIHDRVVFIMPFVPHPTYLRLNELCDVMLDTLHWSGGNTSLDALACGLPVVTMPGPLMRGRQSQAMLKVLGAGELVVDDIDRYIDTAVRLGRDATWRRALSERILANRGELFEREEPIRALEEFLESAAQGRRG